MDKEKFHVHMPDEHTIQAEINRIVAVGVEPRKSFYSFLKTMYKQIGFKHLFYDRSEPFGIFLAAISILSFFSIYLIDPIYIRQQDIYSFIFLISPVLYITVSLYTFASKLHHNTYEVEMACKYNVYQIVAFRMLLFSIASIFANTICVYSIVLFYGDISFLRAWMISITALFLFSIIFLYVMMKKRSMFAAYATIGGWMTVNIAFSIIDNSLYYSLLMKMPIFVYAVVIFICITIYLKKLSKLIHLKPTEGAF